MNEGTLLTDTESYLKGRRDGITIGESQQGGRNMKCPMLNGRVGLPRATQLTDPTDCLKGSCDWWRNGQCDPTGLIESMNSISDALEDILEKMPSPAAYNKM